MSSSDAPSTNSTQLTQDSISALEYITQQEELGIYHSRLTFPVLIHVESSARDILPYSFQRCTAPLGPLRQALYACLTCSPVLPETQHGGICYSCSIQCHGSHNLVELFCKRDFTCDCGTTRMGSTSCSLRKVSQQQPNAKNEYNHNFEGRFCECDQVYDVDAEEGTMFQCLVCEDWFHEKCIGEGRVPDQDDFDGFVCKTCVGKNEWLGRYVANKEIFMSTLDTHPEAKIDVEKVDEVATKANESSNSPEIQGITETSSEQPIANGMKRSHSAGPEAAEQPTKRAKVEDVPEKPVEPCKWASLPDTPSVPFALFLKENFRDHLCRCITCEITRLRTLPMISHEEETYEPDEDNSDTGTSLAIQTKHRLVTRRRNESLVIVT